MPEGSREVSIVFWVNPQQHHQSALRCSRTATPKTHATVASPLHQDSVTLGDCAVCKQTPLGKGVAWRGVHVQAKQILPGGATAVPCK